MSVLGFESEDTPAEQMAETAFREGTIERTAEGFPIRRREKMASENDETLHITTWEVAIPVPPRSLRLAIFSYTMLLSQHEDPPFIAEVALLEASIKQATYSQEQGEAGDYEHA